MSMLAFAKLYKRDEFYHVERLRSELSNLNNFVIVLLPPWDVIVKRFKVRGDEIHDFISLRSVYKVFEEAASDLESLPNVCVIRNEIDEFTINSLISRLIVFENSDYPLLAGNFMQACMAEAAFEKIGISLTSYDYGDFSDICKKSLDYEEEKEYYKEIEKSVLKKIDDELNGDNEYSRKESVSSRRFIYTSDTCISLAHFLVRENMLDSKIFIRSSNTRDTLRYDMNFIKHLCKSVKDHLGLGKNTITKIQMLVNSAHIPSNID
jgi:hypothetical protein